LNDEGGRAGRAGIFSRYGNSIRRRSFSVMLPIGNLIDQRRFFPLNAVSASLRVIRFNPRSMLFPCHGP
jgi:hypothetical protein